MIFVFGFLLVGWLVHNWLSDIGSVVKNYGISFGINGLFFIIMGVLFMVVLTSIWWRYNYFGSGIMFIGGGINLIDRIFFGYVRDYWRFGWVYNNLADWIIQFGVIIILLELWIKKSK